MHYTIPLARNLALLIDEEDYPLISQFKWNLKPSKVDGRYYAQSAMKVGDKFKTFSLHRFLFNFPKGQEVDHINGDGLDNRRCNLRLCTRAENNHNAKTRKDNKSGFKGVYFHARDNCWVAQIRFNKKARHLGSFHSVTEAAHAYDQAAKELFGEFAVLNFPEAGAPA